MALQPLVSIVIPCFNHGRFLRTALDSVLAQTFSQWEAIVVDDGSTDRTHDVVASCPDPRIRYVYQPNQGLSAARNTGIDAARGGLLTFLDADDEWNFEFLAQCTKVLEARPELVGVYSLCCFIDPQGSHLPISGGQCVAESEFQVRNLEGGFFPVHAAMVRKSAVCQVGRFDETLTSEEDWDLWIRIGQHGAMMCIPMALAYYRVYPGSMSTNAERMLANAMTVLSKYYGPPEGELSTWELDKRRVYGFALRGAALRFMQQRENNRGWQLLAEAVELWPLLLTRLDTFYEVVLGDQPLGYRGEVRMVDVASNGAQMIQGLADLFRYADGPVLEFRHVAIGNAYLTLAMLSDQAGDWKSARHYLLQSFRHDPGLMSMSSLRRFLKLSLGPSVVRFLRSLTTNERS